MQNHGDERARVLAAFRKAVEGDLEKRAALPGGGKDFSRSSTGSKSVHSKSTHDFSKSKVHDADEEAREGSYQAFAEEYLRHTGH